MCHDSAAAHGRVVGAPADEIEITPDMIEAGIDALEDWRCEKIRLTGHNREEMLVERIYLAMASCQKQAC